MIHKGRMYGLVCVEEWERWWRLLKTHFLPRGLFTIEKVTSEPDLYELANCGHLTVLVGGML